MRKDGRLPRGQRCHGQRCHPPKEPIRCRQWGYWGLLLLLGYVTCGLVTHYSPCCPSVPSLQCTSSALRSAPSCSWPVVKTDSEGSPPGEEEAKMRSGGEREKKREKEGRGGMGEATESAERLCCTAFAWSPSTPKSWLPTA